MFDGIYLWTSPLQLRILEGGKAHQWATLVQDSPNRKLYLLVPMRNGMTPPPQKKEENNTIPLTFMVSFLRGVALPPGSFDQRPDSSVRAPSHRRPSPAIAGHRRPSPAIAGHRRPSPAIAGHRRPSPAIAGHRRPATWPPARFGHLDAPRPDEIQLEHVLQGRADEKSGKMNWMAAAPWLAPIKNLGPGYLPFLSLLPSFLPCLLACLIACLLA